MERKRERRERAKVTECLFVCDTKVYQALTYYVKRFVHGASLIHEK